MLLVTHDLREAGFLASRICGMGPRPGRVISDEAVTLPQPRDIATIYSAEFVEMTRGLREMIAQVRTTQGRTDVRRRAHPPSVHIADRRLLRAVGGAVHPLLLDVSDLVLPRPSGIIFTIYTRFPVPGSQILQTLSSTLTGFALGVTIGVPLGVIVGISRVAYAAAYPLLVGF